MRAPRAEPRPASRRSRRGAPSGVSAPRAPPARAARRAAAQACRAFASPELFLGSSAPASVPSARASRAGSPAPSASAAAAAVPTGVPAPARRRTGCAREVAAAARGADCIAGRTAGTAAAAAGRIAGTAAAAAGRTAGTVAGAAAARTAGTVGGGVVRSTPAAAEGARAEPEAPRVCWRFSTPRGNRFAASCTAEATAGRGGHGGQTAASRGEERARARARSSVLMSRRDASTRGRRAPCESPHASRRASWRERDRLDFDALLFADRGSRTDTVGGCVNSGPAKGLCGGNWMNPDPTTREGFCGATDRGAEGSVGVRTGGRPGTRGASIAARR